MSAPGRLAASVRGASRPAMPVEIANESDVPVDEAGLAGLCRFVLADLGINPMAELSVLIVDVAYMASLNERWMGEKGPTDVLAFPMDELTTARRPDDPEPGPSLLGDVVLCPAVAVRQAAAAGHGFEDELHLLTAHGILHLLGYDHGDAEEEREMFGVQATVLRSWRASRREDGAAR